jgi:hypothetical protein
MQVELCILTVLSQIDLIALQKKATKLADNIDL